MVFSVRDALLGVAVPSRFRQFQGVPSRVQRTRTHILFARLIHLLSAELIPPPPPPRHQIQGPYWLRPRTLTNP